MFMYCAVPAVWRPSPTVGMRAAIRQCCHSDRSAMLQVFVVKDIGERASFIALLQKQCSKKHDSAKVQYTISATKKKKKNNSTIRNFGRLGVKK
jgi:hypothetical protein